MRRRPALRGSSASPAACLLLFYQLHSCHLAPRAARPARLAPPRDPCTATATCRHVQAPRKSGTSSMACSSAAALACSHMQAALFNAILSQCQQAVLRGKVLEVGWRADAARRACLLTRRRAGCGRAMRRSYDRGHWLRACKDRSRCARVRTPLARFLGDG